MMGPIVNTGLIITLFAIAAPFVFVLVVIRMFTGGSRNKGSNERNNQRDNNEEMREIARGLKDLNRRIDNLETIKKHKRDKE